MIRSLVIRQSFLVLDAALVILALATGVMVVFKFFEAPVMPPAPPSAHASAGSGDIVREIGDRLAYNGIVETSKLFGDAGAYDPNAEPKVEQTPVVDNTPVETDVPLRLVGTTATEKLASAIIEDTSQPGSAHSYDLGEMVVQDVTLEEVHARHVLIHNKRDGKDQIEKLSMDDEKGKQPSVTAPTVPASTGPTDRVTLKRAELVNEISANYLDLITKVKPELYRDASGKVVGITANNIGQIPVAKKLGLGDGDVLQTVNNEQIDSEAKVMEMVSKYSNATSFRIGILRNGKPKVVTYRLE